MFISLFLFLNVGLYTLNPLNSLTKLVIIETIITSIMIGIKEFIIALTSIGVTTVFQPPYNPLNSLTKLVMTLMIITRKIIGIKVFINALTSIGVTIFQPTLLIL